MRGSEPGARLDGRPTPCRAEGSKNNAETCGWRVGGARTHTCWRLCRAYDTRRSIAGVNHENLSGYYYPTGQHHAGAEVAAIAARAKLTVV